MTSWLFARVVSESASERVGVSVSLSRLPNQGRTRALRASRQTRDGDYVRPRTISKSTASRIIPSNRDTLHSRLFIPPERKGLSKIKGCDERLTPALRRTLTISLVVPLSFIPWLNIVRLLSFPIWRIAMCGCMSPAERVITASKVRLKNVRIVVLIHVPRKRTRGGEFSTSGYLRVWFGISSYCLCVRWLSHISGKEIAWIVSLINNLRRGRNRLYSIYTNEWTCSNNLVVK